MKLLGFLFKQTNQQSIDKNQSGELQFTVYIKTNTDKLIDVIPSSYFDLIE